MTQNPSIWSLDGSRLRNLSMLSALVLALALGACRDETGPPPEGKSPFATGNVSVAPQLEGREGAPTPVPAPRPTQ